MKNLVAKLSEKKEEELFDRVLCIIDDINQSHKRFYDMTHRKRQISKLFTIAFFDPLIRPKPFLSSYKNRDLRPTPEEPVPIKKRRKRKTFDDEYGHEDAKNEGFDNNYNQFEQKLEEQSEDNYFGMGSGNQKEPEESKEQEEMPDLLAPAPPPAEPESVQPTPQEAPVVNTEDLLSSNVVVGAPLIQQSVVTESHTDAQLQQMQMQQLAVQQQIVQSQLQVF